MIWSPYALSVEFLDFPQRIVFQCYSLYLNTFLAKYTEVNLQLKQYFFLHEYQIFRTIEWNWYCVAKNGGFNLTICQHNTLSTCKYIVPWKSSYLNISFSITFIHFQSHFGSVCRLFWGILYDWRHEKRALKVKILHFEFLLLMASPKFSLSKKYEIFVFSMCITFLISIFLLYVPYTKNICDVNMIICFSNTLRMHLLHINIITYYKRYNLSTFVHSSLFPPLYG